MEEDSEEDTKEERSEGKRKPIGVPESKDESGMEGWCAVVVLPTRAGKLQLKRRYVPIGTLSRTVGVMQRDGTSERNRAKNSGQ